MMTIVGHKFYGPRVGALYCKNPHDTIKPMFVGGNQERGLRLVAYVIYCFNA